ncbi:MAG: hypothetical protein O7G31_11060 [Calditrichaeota bacterium]|nr:hypothetical protein [Calditrichota bacterium]
MQKGFFVFVLVVLLTLISSSSSQAQYFVFDEENYDQASDVEDAVGAALKFFGSVVGGGFFHTADLHSAGGFDVGIRGVVANVPEDFKTLPVFSEEDLVGLAFLHGSVGLPGNFELFGRFFYFPLGNGASLNPPRVDSRGGVTLIGGGLKYGLVQLPGLPKVLVMGAYHALLVPSEFDFGTVGTLSLKAVASYSLPILTVYLGGGIDFTRLELDADLPFFPDLAGESFTENQPHFTVGAKVTPFPLLHVNGSYTFSEFKSFDLGIGVSFR